MLAYVFSFLLAFTAWFMRPGPLGRAMLTAWALSAVAGIFLPKPFMPGAFAVIDGAVAMVGLMLWTQFRCQNARIIGLISMVLICAHFGYSAGNGVGDWMLYASTVNAGFALQCFTAGGGWSGLVRFYHRFRRRHPHLSVSLHKRR